MPCLSRVHARLPVGLKVAHSTLHSHEGQAYCLLTSREAGRGTHLAYSARTCFS